ncbi:MAG: hypothetical protein KKD39_08205, partial [Candidatus Altiarchaeota archaeon]|nr:hypothetical protein [Candidatus Altiarchaeota archaeon]
LNSFGYKPGEYIYIFLVSALFLFSCLKFCQKTKINKILFYALVLNSYTLNFGFLAGTELLTLSLLILSLTYINNIKSPISYGLALLSRYTNAPYAVIYLFRKDKKEILKFFLVIFILFTPWMTYNFILKGHPFYSMASSYFFNVIVKDGGFTGPKISDTAPSLIMYILLAFAGFIKELKQGLDKNSKLMIVFFLITIVSYVFTPFKELRYLYNLILPIGYFSTKFSEHIIDCERKKIAFLICFSLLTYTATAAYIQLQPPKGLDKAVGIVDRSCIGMSNGWVYLNYFDIPTEAQPRYEFFEKEINEGKWILIFKSNNLENISIDKQDLEKYVVEENEDYTLYREGIKCAPVENIDKPYIEKFNSRGGNVSLCPVVPFICSM